MAATEPPTAAAEVSVSRRYRFSASHRLHSRSLSDAENQRVYGKCNHPFGHGHDYVLDVTVRGPLDARSGRVIGVPLLDEYIRRQVTSVYEWKYLNVDLPEWRDAAPTAEHIAKDIAARLEHRWPAEFSSRGVHLAAVRLEETRRNTVEIRYEDQ
jgi:6-pyruvoyltetrahydropterin/6-carboxytetrahydropterin synthase